MQDYTDDFVRHKKKSSAKPPKKSKHKHYYEDCILDTPDCRYDKVHGMVYDQRKLVFGGYCPVCGKIGDVDTSKWFNMVKGKGPSAFLQTVYHEEHNDAAKRELNPETRTLPVFELTEMFGQKYVDLEGGGT